VTPGAPREPSIEAGAPRSSIVGSLPLALAVIALLGVIYAVLARYVFDRFPYSGDEYSLALQGELFARGLLEAPAPAHLEWLRVDHVLIDAFIRSKYPPGAAFLLGLGERGGVAWLITPLEGVVGVTLVWHTVRRLLGPREGLIALIAIGLAPLHAVQAATFYAHTATVMFLAIAFAGVAGWLRGARTGWLVIVGAALGCAFLTRPIDGLLFGLAMVSLRSWRAVIVPALAALPFVAIHLWYQAQFGSALTDGYAAYEPTLFALYGRDIAPHPFSIVNLWDPVQLWNHLDICRAFVVGWTVPGAVLVALFGALAMATPAARTIRRFSLVLIAVYVAALLLTIADPDDGARPRYLTPILIPVALLTAAGFAPASAALAARFGQRVRGVVVSLAIVFAVLQVVAIVYDRLPLRWERQGLYRAVEDAQLRAAVVIVRARYPSRFARNGPWFDRDVLYLSAPPDVRVETIGAAYPGRTIWEAREGTPWTLTRVP